MAATVRILHLLSDFFTRYPAGAALYDPDGKRIDRNRAIRSLQTSDGTDLCPADLFRNDLLSDEQQQNLKSGRPVLLTEPMHIKIAPVEHDGERIGYTLSIFSSDACFRRNCLQYKAAETAQDTILLVNRDRRIEQVISPGIEASVFTGELQMRRIDELPGFLYSDTWKEEMNRILDACLATDRTENLTISIKRDTGESVYYQIRIVPLQRIHFLLYLRNVTEETRIERENRDLSSILSESRSMMELALKNSRITTYSFNFDRFRQCDRVHCKRCFQFCGAPNRLLGKNQYICRALTTLRDPEDRTDFFFLFNKIRNERIPEYTTTFRIKTDTGEFRSYDVVGKAHTVDSEGRPNLIIGYVIDNHDRIQNEEKLLREKKKAQAADRLKSTFLANITHDLRTPLNAIIGFSDLLSIETDPEMRQNYIDLIKTNNDMLMRLISDVLDISKIEANMLAFQPAAIGLQDFIREIYQTVLLKMPEGVELQTEAETEITLYTDPTRLTQVLVNLLTNAIKYTSEGFIRFGYRATDREVRFYVSDTGCGIPAAEQESVFTRFVQLEGHKPGTGLGLAICKGLVTKMGGTISIRSEPGKGSTFEFTHPLVAPPAE